VAFYNQLRSKDGSVEHLGDNRTGEGEGDDEVIRVDLTAVPPQVDVVMFVVTSYEGQTFEQVQNAYCRLVDAADGELARYQLAGGTAPWSRSASTGAWRSATSPSTTPAAST
jgi:stress response protein SCP2